MDNIVWTNFEKGTIIKLLSGINHLKEGRVNGSLMKAMSLNCKFVGVLINDYDTKQARGVICKPQKGKSKLSLPSSLFRSFMHLFSN